MAKKKSKSKGFVSKGERPNVSKWTRKATRRHYLSSGLVVDNNKLRAWKQGKRVWVTMPNNGSDKAKMPYKRVLATEAWGDPRRRFTMKQTAE